MMTSKTAELLKRAESQRTSESEQSSVVHARSCFQTLDEARTSFNYFAGKLFQIENWNASAGQSSYELFDKNGRKQFNKLIAMDDFIRISLKGAIKYDWVEVTEIYRTVSEVTITVRPTYDPTEETPDENVTSHFFNSDAVNNFCLEIADRNVNFYVIGLNEKTNISETKNFVETIRNAATTNIGSYLGIQQAEWKTFCERFLEIAN